MLLTLHNLPQDMRYSDIKILLREKCGLTEVILDNLLPVGNTKKVTIGVSEEADAAIIVRKINGLHMKGQQLYVEDIRKKRKANEQPFRSSDTYYNNEMVNEVMPEQPAATAYIDPQAAYQQMNYAMMAGMYGYMPQVQDPNFSYAAQNMPVMPVMPAMNTAMNPAGIPAINQVNDWQNSQLQQDQGGSWHVPQSHEGYNQECSPSGDSWQNRSSGDPWLNPPAHDGFRQDRQGWDDSQQNHPARESYRQRPRSREDRWQNQVEGSTSTQGRHSRWEPKQPALLTTPVDEARPHFEHARPETSGRDVHSRDERRRSPGNSFSSNDHQAFDDRRQRLPRGRGFERQIAAEPETYARSQERDNSRSRPLRDKRAFEEPQRPFRPEKRARYGELSGAPAENRPMHQEPTFPAPTEDRSHWDGQRQERRSQSHGQGHEQRPVFERPAPRESVEKVMRREETYRQQATAKIANLMTERSPIEVTDHPLFIKILKTTIRIRLDRIIGDKSSGILPDEMVKLYSVKFPRGADGHTNNAVRKRLEYEIAAREMAEQESGAPAVVPPQVPPKMPPIKAPATVVKKVPGPAKPVKFPKGGLPKFPNKDKSVVKQQKQMRKLEAQYDEVDELYPLPPLTKAALDTEIEAITDIINQECADPPEEDKITCKKILKETVDDMKKRTNRERIESHIASDTSTETVIIGLATPETSPVANRVDISTCDNYIESQSDIKFKVKEDVEDNITDLNYESNEKVKSNNENTEKKCVIKETYEFDADCEDESDECQVIETLDNILVVNLEQEEVDQLLEINTEEVEEEAYKDKILANKNKNKFFVVDKQNVDDAITNIVQNRSTCRRSRRKAQRREKEIFQKNMINSEHSYVTDKVRKEDTKKIFDTSDDSDVDMQEKFYDSITNICHNQNDNPSNLAKDSIERAPNIVIQIPLSRKDERICKLIDDKTEQSESSANANNYDNIDTESDIECEIDRRRPASRCKRRRLLNSTLKYDMAAWADSAYASKDNTQFEINDNSIAETGITNNPSCSENNFVNNVAESDAGRLSRRCRWRRNLRRKLADDHLGPTEGYCKKNKENTQRNNTVSIERTDKSNEIQRSYEESDARSLLTRIRNEKIPTRVKNANTSKKCCYREEDINDLLAKIRHEEECSETEREIDS